MFDSISPNRSDSGPATKAVRRWRGDPADRPFIVIWEVTRACDLACRHCRAEAVSEPDPRELTKEEGFALLEQVKAFGTPSPLLVLSGGDPFKRSDLLDLVARASELGLHVAVSPSGTPTITEDRLLALREAGVAALSLSIDGSSPEIHDRFRGVEGVFGWTLEAFEVAKRIGFRVQVNTTAGPHNLDDLPRILRLVRDLGASLWSVFFLVPVGRGAELPQLTPRQFEDVLHFLYEAALLVSVKTTEAPQFRRVVAQRLVLERRGIPIEVAMTLGDTYRMLRDRARELLPGIYPSAPGRIMRLPADVNAGRGFVFVSHVGTVHPSGFLPIVAGDVRRRPLAEIYRSSPLFVALRDADRLQGRCGRCEFRSVCGGSRSRAYGATGDPLASEPWCPYEPGSFPFAEDVAQILGVA